MEHLVQFGISVDDERIEAAVISAAEKEVTKAFEEKHGYYSDEGFARKIIERCVNSKLEELKSEIIESAGKQLCDYLKRTKAVKEAANRIIADTVE